MDIYQFMERFDPVRNTFDASAPLLNLMFENDGSDQSEYVEKQDAHKVWSYSPEKGGLVNGMSFKNGVIGYIVCKKDCMFKAGTIIVKI